MRILHVNNLANTAVVLRDAQRKLGHEVLVVQMWRGESTNWPEDIRLTGEVGKGATSLSLWNLSRWADVVHVHGEFPPRALRWLGWQRRLVLHFHGDEVRDGKWRKMVNYADQVILASPDLEALCPIGYYIPKGVPLRELVQTRRGWGYSRIIRVVHAHGNWGEDLERTKGTAEIRRAVESLEGFEFVEVSGLPHDEALQVYSTCDIAVDHIGRGWLGVFGLECMSMGIPTLCVSGPAYPTSGKMLVDDLRRLRDPGLREEVGVAQRRYVIENHDPDEIAKRVTELYTPPDFGPFRTGDW